MKLTIYLFAFIKLYKSFNSYNVFCKNKESNEYKIRTLPSLKYTTIIAQFKNRVNI